MGGLSGLFDIARSAVAADQAALNATANNVANQNTAGYVRQTVSFHAGDSVTLSGRVTATSGPVVTASSVRDRVLEQRVQQQTQVQAETGARADALAQIEGVFSLNGSASTAGGTQIGTALNGLFNSLTTLAANPADPATRQGALGAASTLAVTFNAAATQLSAIGATIDTQVANSVTAINGLTATIAHLNGQIGSNSPNADAGPLEDQRQLAIAQLSQYVGLDQISTEQNGVTLTTRGGTVLVAGTNAYQLSSTVTNGSTQIRDSSGSDVTGTIQGGSVGGQLTAQQVDLPAVTSSLDALAYRVATAVNAQNVTGTDAGGAPGRPIFTIPAGPGGAASAIAVIPGSSFASAAVGEGVGGNTNANALLDLATATDAGGQTMLGNLASMLSQVGTDSSALQQQNMAQQASLTQLTTQRDSLSGVSLDAEAANLSQYQRSYEAGAKLLSILDSLMAQAINLGTPTPVA